MPGFQELRFFLTDGSSTSAQPVIPFRDEHLEPRSLPVISGFPDGDLCNRQDLTDQEQAKAGVPAETFVKDPGLILRRDTHAIILTYDQEAFRSFTGGKNNLRHVIAMSQRIIDKVVEHFFTMLSAKISVFPSRISISMP